MNETLDLSLAASWPDFAVAWCASNNPVCNPPNQVIDLLANGSIEKVWIDQRLFKYGTYYRWDGMWHRGENSVAFVVAPGKRPNATPTITNLTDKSRNLTPLNLKDFMPEGPYNFIIARGDSPVITMHFNRTDPAHLWIWNMYQLDTLDIPLVSDGNGTYTYRMKPDETWWLDPDDYESYVQFNGENKKQDIYFDKETSTLDSPYDNRFVKDVPVASWNYNAIRQQFDELVIHMTPLWWDDVIIKVNFQVEEPDMRITDIRQDPDKIWISGRTNWDNSTVVTLMLDPDQQALPQDKRLHTWQTYASGEINEYRTFSTAMKIDKSELATGSTHPHDIVMTTTKDGNNRSWSYTFLVSNVYVFTPTPTPTMRILTTTDGVPIATRATPVTVVPTVPVLESVTLENVNRSYVLISGYENITVAPTTVIATTIPNSTKTVSTSKPAPTKTYDPNIYVPVPVWVPLLALVFVVWRRKK